MHYELVSLAETEGITADQVRNYAALHGWQPVESRRTDVLLMRHPHHDVSEIALPLSTDFADYREAVALAISRLAVYLEQPAWKLIDEIITTANPSEWKPDQEGRIKGPHAAAI